MYEWDFRWVWTYRTQLWEAFTVTIELNAAVLLVGTTAGILVGVFSYRAQGFWEKVVRGYVDIFRTLPVLVLLVWFFFCVPLLLGGIRISAFMSAVIVLSLNLSAFLAEIVRAGLNAVPREYVEDAYACGLGEDQTDRYITFPYAVRMMLPPLVGQYINTIKLSVLATVIAVPELLHRTTDIISQTYRPLEFYTVLAGFFLLILLPGTVYSRFLEARTKALRAESGR